MLENTENKSIDPEITNLVDNQDSAIDKTLSEDTVVEAKLVSHDDTSKVNSDGSNTEPESDFIVKAGMRSIGADRGPQDNILNFDVNEYKEYLGGTVFMDNMEDINREMADKQTWYQQAGNFAGQAVVGEIIGGTIEGLGYLLDVGSVMDVMKGDEAEWGNFMTDFGQSIREGTQEAMQIHQDPDAQGWSKMLDSGWWFQNSVSVASTLSMLVPTMGAMKALSFAGKGIGTSKGLSSVRKAIGLAEDMSVQSKWMTEGITQAVLSRNIENWMEAHGTFESAKSDYLNRVNPETKEKFTEEEATKMASDAASNNWKMGWAMLLQDIPQYLALGKVFNPATRKMENALNVAKTKGVSSKIKPWQKTGIGAASTFFGEAGEESYQYLISERAKLLSDLDAGLINQEQYDKKISDAFGNEEMLTSAFFGGLGGNLFQFAGKGVSSALKSKDRKTYEENLGKYYDEAITNNAKQTALMYQQLANADQEGSRLHRSRIINESMMNMTAQALENDRFEQFYETIDHMANMSDEDVAALSETGQEFSRELAAEYAPEIKKKALKMREIYLGYRNKNFNTTTANRLSKIEMSDIQLEETIKKKAEDVSNIRSKAGSSFENNATPEHISRLEVRERGIVLRRRDKALKAKKKAEVSPIKKEWIQKAIDANEIKRRQHKRDEAKNRLERKEATKGLSKEEKAEIDDKESLVNDVYDSIKDDIIDAREISEVASELLIENTEDMKYSKSETGQNMAKAVKKEREVEFVKTEEDADRELEEVSKAEYLDDTQKEELKKILENKKTKIGEAKAKEEAKANAEEIEKEKKEKAKAANSNPLFENNNVKTELGEVVEDENAEALIDTDTILVKELDKSLKGNVSGVNLALLDKVEGTEAFQEWYETPVSKIGKVFEYTVSPRSQNLTDEQNDAIESFEKGIINQSVYENLPIKATLQGVPKVFTYIATKPGKNASEEIKLRYKIGNTEQRANIINRMNAGEKVTAKVHRTSSGSVNTYHDTENNLAPEHSIREISQMKGIPASSMEIMVTDDSGYLVDVYKEAVRELPQQMIVGQDEDGADIPYKGGVFLKVKTPEGKPFPLKLNLLRNTREQAEMLSDLLIRIAVPVARKDEQGNYILNNEGKRMLHKEYKLSTELNNVDPGLKEDIMELMGDEVRMLDPDNNNPTLVDLINSFVYVSKKTENKTSELFFDGDQLVFGGKKIGLKERSADQSFLELTDFLQNKKRRQFSLRMWHTVDGYKDYVIDNNIINTNLKPNAPVFVNNRERSEMTGNMIGRRISTYMTPVPPLEQSGPTKSPSGTVSPSNGPATRSGIQTEYGTSFVIPGMEKREAGPKPPLPNQTQQTSEVEEKLENMFSLEEKIPLKDVLSKLIGNSSGEIKEIYKKLLNVLPEVNIVFSKNIRNNASGEFIYLEDLIKIDYQKKNIDKTLLHEIIHALTEDRLLKDDKFNSKITEYRNIVLNHFKDKKPRALQGSNKTTLSNNSEFLAGIFNFNNEFLLKELNSIPSGRKTILEDIKKLFLNLIENVLSINNLNINKDSILFEIINELDSNQPTQQTSGVEFKKVYHHTSVSLQNFNFGNFQRGKNQVSQFGDGLNAATETNEFFTKRYGQPIEGEVNDKDFVEIDTNLSESEIYDYLTGLGYKINTPQYKSGKYNSKSAKEEYDDVDPANDNPAVINLFNDFQQSNPDVKGVKVVNHIIGDSKVKPFYVIYDAKSFYGPGSLSKQPTPQTSEEGLPILSEKEKEQQEKKANLEEKGFSFYELMGTWDVSFAGEGVISEFNDTLELAIKDADRFYKQSIEQESGIDVVSLEVNEVVEPTIDLINDDDIDIDVSDSGFSFDIDGDTNNYGDMDGMDNGSATKNPNCK